LTRFGKTKSANRLKSVGETPKIGFCLFLDPKKSSRSYDGSKAMADVLNLINMVDGFLNVPGYIHILKTLAWYVNIIENEIEDSADSLVTLEKDFVTMSLVSLKEDIKCQNHLSPEDISWLSSTAKLLIQERMKKQKV